MLRLPFTLAKVTCWHIVYVVRDLWRPCIIGNNFIRAHNLHFDGGQQRIFFPSPRTLPSTLRRPSNSPRSSKQPPRALHHLNTPATQFSSSSCTTHSPRFASKRTDATTSVFSLLPDISPPLNLSVSQSSSPMYVNTISHTPPPSTTDVPDFNDSILSSDQTKVLVYLIQSFPTVFTTSPGRTATLQHHIDLLPGTKPRNSAPYRYSPARRLIIESQLTEMLDQGIIIPSKSPWASPVVLAPKKDGSIRFCIDYRKLNDVTIKDAYPIPRIDDTLDALHHAQYVSTLDLRSGYWQVELDHISRPITAFVTHKGLFECVVMPFGLTNAPATFQRLMDVVLAGLKWQCCLVYLDDIIVYSPTFEQHLQDLRNVFIALEAARLTLKPPKCNFCRAEMKFLGHIITAKGIKPDPSLISTVTQFPPPTNIKQVQAFLGLTGYYRRFIRNYAKIAEPLLKLLRSQKSTPRNASLPWNLDCTSAFHILKDRLISPPIMRPPNFSFPFILELDACEYGIGCILTQEYDHHKYVIAYASRTLSPAERNYSSVEREALAIVWATKHFRQYLEGGPVIVRSDCKALEWLKTARDPTGRLARWAMKLSPYHLKIQHRPGTSNPNGDFVSRYPLQTTDSTAPELNAIEYGLNILDETNILDDIRSQQLADPRLSRLIQSLRHQPSLPFNKQHTPYIIINDILYKVRHLNSYTQQRLLGNKHLLVIPQSLQQTMLVWAHDHPTAGHAGRTKTLFRLTSRVYWPSMRKDVFQYIQSCSSCQQFKYNNSPTAAPMQLHSVTQPWYTIGIDIMGPFPPTFRQKKYLLVIVDYFTRWVEMFALRQTTSTDVANILINEVICRYGLPSYILSDNGPQFISNLFIDICSSLGIQRKLTAFYHPQTNMTERVNRNLKAQIAIYAHRHPGLWDKELQKLAFSIRTSINETTGETPAFLNFGRDLRLPLDLLISDPLPNPSSATPEYAYIRTYRSNLIKSLRLASDFAREHSEVQKIAQKTAYDKHTSNRQFLLGDLVWVQIPTPRIDNTPITNKLRPKYQGPCRLTEQLTPSTFIAIRLHDNVSLGPTNVDRMKLYYTPAPLPLPILPAPAPTPTTRRYPLRSRRPPARF